MLSIKFKYSLILVFIFVLLSCDKTNRTPNKNVDAFFSISEIKKDVEKLGVKIFFESKNKRTDFFIYQGDIDFEKSSNFSNEKILKPERIDVFLSPNKYLELKYHKDSVTGHRFVMANVEEVLLKYPLKIDLKVDGKRRSIYIYNTETQKKEFFPNVLNQNDKPNQ